MMNASTINSASPALERPPSPSQTAKKVAGGLIALGMLLSGVLSMFFPAYLIDYVLARDETVEVELPLYERWPTQYRTPLEYQFEVAGVRYAGIPFLSDEGVRYDHETGEATARVVYSVLRPAFHRIEPVDVIGGFRMVEIFPYWLAVCLFLFLVALGISCQDQLRRLRRGAALPKIEIAQFLNNLATLPVLLGLPFLAVLSVTAFAGEYQFLDGLGPTLAGGTVACLILLVVLAKIGNALETARIDTPTSNTARPSGPILPP